MLRNTIQPFHFTLHAMLYFGLIGKKLGHSFSKEYFEQKWRSEKIDNCIYKNYELESLDKLPDLLQSDINLIGLNVTNPYKIQIIPYMDQLTTIADETQSVNCIKKINGKWIGHNTDALSFLNSLTTFLPIGFQAEALILGSGGASKSIQWAIKHLDLHYAIASSSGNGITYPELHFNWNPDWKLIINTTPLGTWPGTSDLPDIPYQFIDDSYYLYDLIYNPEKTLFLKRGAEQGSAIKNGLEMLHLQADKSWQFWNE